MARLKKKQILFYSSVKDLSAFQSQTFYKNDILCLERAGFHVSVTNNLFDFLYKGFDIAFLYFYKFSLLAALISKLRLKKVFVTGGIDALSGVEGKSSFIIQTILVNLLLPFINKCLIVSQSDLQNIKKITPKSMHRRFVISPHSVNLANASVNVNDKREENFVTICWMESVKNIERKGVIRAIKHFRKLKTKYKKYQNSKLFIIGRYDKKSLDYIENEVNVSSDKSICFEGQISDERKYVFFLQNKYYYQLSSYEGFGLAALEALSMGMYVLHTGKGGLKDTMKDYGQIITEDMSNIFGYENFIKSHREIVSEINIRFSHKNRIDDFQEFMDNKD